MLGAYLWGIDGVALATDVMALASGVLLCRYLWEVVDFSLFRLAFWPAGAVGLAWAGGILAEHLWLGPATWPTAVVKVGVFALLYLGVLVVAERQQTVQGVRWAWAQVRSAPAQAPAQARAQEL
jgi:hypothetical protein